MSRLDAWRNYLDFQEQLLVRDVSEFLNRDERDDLQEPKDLISTHVNPLGSRVYPSDLDDRHATPPAALHPHLYAFNTPSVLTAGSSRSANTRQIVKIVSQDARLARSVLQMANSVYYAQENQVRTLMHAALLVGHETIRVFALRSISSRCQSLRQTSARFKNRTRG